MHTDKLFLDQSGLIALLKCLKQITSKGYSLSMNDEYLVLSCGDDVVSKISISDITNPETPDIDELIGRFKDVDCLYRDDDGVVHANDGETDSTTGLIVKDDQTILANGSQHLYSKSNGLFILSNPTSTTYYHSYRLNPYIYGFPMTGSDEKVTALPSTYDPFSLGSATVTRTGIGRYTITHKLGSSGAVRTTTNTAEYKIYYEAIGHAYMEDDDSVRIPLQLCLTKISPNSCEMCTFGPSGLEDFTYAYIMFLDYSEWFIRKN